jgi:hypothetical protein
MKTRLQQFLKKKFGVIVSKNLPFNPTLPRIEDRIEYESGDPYGGYTSHYKLVLHNFIRPDNYQKLELIISYSLHHLSGQMDYWDVIVEGMELAEFMEMRKIIDPYQYDDFSNNNYMKPTFILNGKEIDFDVVGSENDIL